MLAILSLLVVVVVSLSIVKVATTALVLTGLSTPLARFQARSAFTGAGFTTTESERVVGHPVRRRIIMLLMLMGNAGLITAVSSLMLSFVNNGATTWQGTVFRFVFLFGGLGAIWLLSSSVWLDRRMTGIIQWALKRFTDLELRDYAGLLHLTGEYVVAELNIREGDWLSGRPLKQLRLSDEGVLVLGIERTDGKYIGTPRGDMQLSEGDLAIVYGRQENLKRLDDRRQGSKGAWDHVKAVEEQIKERDQAVEETTDNANR